MSFSRRYDDSEGTEFSLRYVVLPFWCMLCIWGIAVEGLVPFLSLGVPLILFGIWPPIRFMHGGRLWPRKHIRWARRPYRLTDFPRIFYRMRLALPTLILMLLVLLEAPPSNLPALYAVVGAGVWSIWFALKCSSQRGEIAWQWSPVQGIVFGMLLLCLLFATDPQRAANWTRQPARQVYARVGARTLTGVEFLGLSFGKANATYGATRTDVFPERWTEDETESFFDRYERARVRADWLSRRERE